MGTILNIITMVLAIASLIILPYMLIETIKITRPHPNARYKRSMLKRRRKALGLATKEWHFNVRCGYTTLAENSKRLVEQLEREVAALENEPFYPKEEESVTPKPEAPKRNHVTTVRGRYHEVWGRLYRGTCSACDWSLDSYLAQTAVEKGAEHERSHA